MGGLSKKRSNTSQKQRILTVRTIERVRENEIKNTSTIGRIDRNIYIINVPPFYNLKFIFINVDGLI